MKHLSLTHLASGLVAAGLSANAAAQSSTLPSAQILAVQAGSAVMPDPLIQTFVIDSDTLVADPGASIFDVLSTAPSVQLKQNGAPGSTSSVSIRGARPEGTLVLIDGVRYGSVSSAQAQLSLIPAQSVERVEIYYGAAAAARFGADASGGVIQLFTKSQAAGSASLSTFVGTHDQYGASAAGGATLGTATFSAQVGYQEFGGFSSVKDPANFAYEPDRDSYDARFASMQYRQRFGNTELKLSGLINESTTEFDAGDARGNTEQDQLNGGANLELTHRLGSTLLSASHGVSVDKGEVETPFRSYFKTIQNQSKLYAHQGLGANGLVSVGTEYLDQKLDTQGSYAVDHRRIASLVAGVIDQSERFDVSATTRVDKAEGVAPETGGSIAAAYRVLPSVRVGAQAARAYRLPNFNDLYSPFGANPDLEAETTRAGELFAEAQAGKTTGRVTVHRSLVDNYILLDSMWIPQNLDRAVISGVSLTASTSLARTSLSGSYDYLDAKNQNEQVLPYRSRHAVTLSAAQPIGAVVARLEGRYNSAQASQLGGDRNLGGYTLLDAALNGEVNSKLGYRLRVNNLLDTDYELTPGYATAGVEVVGGLTLSY